MLANKVFAVLGGQALEQFSAHDLAVLAGTISVVLGSQAPGVFWAHWIAAAWEDMPLGQWTGPWAIVGTRDFCGFG